MDPQTYTQSYIPLEWRGWLNAYDDPTSTDLSRAAIHAFWAVGGSWTERTKIDTEAGEAAAQYAKEEDSRTDRDCVVCGTAAEGTPRHVQMECPEMGTKHARIRTAIEAELNHKATREKWRRAADRWWAKEEQAGRGPRPPPPPDAEAQKYPILSTWRWYVSSETHEKALKEKGVEAEGIMDLAYRAVVPAEIARLLGSKRFGRDAEDEGDERGEGLDDELERYEQTIDEEAEAVRADVRQAEKLAMAAQTARATNPRARRLGILLVLANRNIRRDYQKKATWWLQLQETRQRQPEAHPNHPPVARPGQRQQLAERT